MDGRRFPATNTGAFLSLLAGSFLVQCACEPFFNVSEFGITPRTTEGIIGIPLMPFLHGGLIHLVVNMICVGWLLYVLFCTYSKWHVYTIIVQITLLSGLLVWLMARGGNVSHIGASGLVYGLLFYALFSSIRYGHAFLWIMCLVIIGITGPGEILSGMYDTHPLVSWEAHLFGGIVGAMIALFEDQPTIIRKRGSSEIRSHSLPSGRPPQDSSMAAKKMEPKSSN